MSRTAKLFRLLVLTSAFFLLFASKTVITYAAFTDSETIDSDLQLRSGYLSLADIGSPFNDGLEGIVDQTASKEIAIKNTGTLQAKVSYSVTSGTSDWSEYVNVSDTGHFNGQVVEPTASISPQLTVKVKKDWTSEDPLVLTVKVRLQQANAKGNNGFYDEKSFTIKISKTQKQPEEEWPDDDKFKDGYYLAQNMVFSRISQKRKTIVPGILFLKDSIINKKDTSGKDMSLERIISEIDKSLVLNQGGSLNIKNFHYEIGKGLRLELVLAEDSSDYSYISEVRINWNQAVRSQPVISGFAKPLLLQTDFNSNSTFKSDRTIAARTEGSKFTFVTTNGTSPLVGESIDNSLLKKYTTVEVVNDQNHNFQAAFFGESQLLVKQLSQNSSGKKANVVLKDKESGEVLFSRPIMGVKEIVNPMSDGTVAWQSTSSNLVKAAVLSNKLEDDDSNQPKYHARIIFKLADSLSGTYFIKQFNNNYTIDDTNYTSDGKFLILDISASEIATKNFEFVLYSSISMDPDSAIIHYGSIPIPQPSASFSVETVNEMTDDSSFSTNQERSEELESNQYSDQESDRANSQDNNSDGDHNADEANTRATDSSENSEQKQQKKQQESVSNLLDDYRKIHEQNQDDHLNIQDINQNTKGADIVPTENTQDSVDSVSSDN